MQFNKKLLVVFLGVVVGLSAFAYYKFSRIDKPKRPPSQKYTGVTFEKSIENALGKDFRNAPKDICMIPLVTANSLPCAGIDTKIKAEVVAVQFQLDNKEKFLYDPSATYEKDVSIASLSKVLIVVPALLSGKVKTTDKFCPKEAKKDNSGALFHRVNKKRPTGFKFCTENQLITLRQAFAQSDNLAFYEVQKKFHSDVLSFLTAFNLPLQNSEESHIDVRLAFGNYIISPRAFFRFYITLFRACQEGSSTDDAEAKKLVQYAKNAKAFSETCSILDAPTTDIGGTLHWMQKNGIGKTGTLKALNNHRFEGKYVVYADRQSNKVALFMVRSDYGIGTKKMQSFDFKETLKILTR